MGPAVALLALFLREPAAATGSPMAASGGSVDNTGSPMAAPAVSSDDVLFTLPGRWAPGVPPIKPPATYPRTLSRVLADRVSVRDFGAFGDCGCRDQAWAETCCPHDDTAAFAAALSTGDDVYVPPGVYRIDGTVELSGQTMVLAGQATLARLNISASTAPVVRLTGWRSNLRGSGTVSTTNAAPRGVVNIGPHDFVRAHNVEWNMLEGIAIRGPGVSWSYSTPTRPVDPALNGSIGVCIDSTEGLQGKASVGGGATYQNTVRGITIRFVDRGVFLGVQANANIMDGITMEAIGQVSPAACSTELSTHTREGALAQRTLSDPTLTCRPATTWRARIRKTVSAAAAFASSAPNEAAA